MKTTKENRDAWRVHVERTKVFGGMTFGTDEVLALLADADRAEELEQQLEDLRLHPRVDDVVRLVSLIDQGGRGTRLELWRQEHIDRASKLMTEMLAGVGRGEPDVSKGTKAFVCTKPMAPIEIAASIEALRVKVEPCQE